MTEAARTADPGDRLALYAQADRRLMQLAIYIPTTYGLGRAFLKPWVRREPRWYHRTGCYGCWKDVIIDPH